MIGSHPEQLDRPTCDRERKQNGERKEKMHKMCTCVIVIARGQGFMAVNKLSPRAKPENKIVYIVVLYSIHANT